MKSVPVILPCAEIRYNDSYSVMVVLRKGIWECFGMKHFPDGTETGYTYMFGLPEESTPDVREALTIAFSNVEDYDDIISGEEE